MSDLLRSLGLEHNPLFSGGLVLMVVGVLGAWLRRIPGMATAAVRRRLVTSVEIHDWDQAFGWTIQWLADQNVMGGSRDLTASTERNQNSSMCSPGYISTPPPPIPKITLAPAPGIHFMRYRGIPTLVTHSRERSWLNSGSVYRETIQFRFLGARRQAVETLMEEIQATGAAKDKTSETRILAPQGEMWCDAGFHPKRPVESLVLDDGWFERTLTDLREFLDSAQWYADRGIPYRRGYLLFGPPGTGKTTTVGVLAAELGFGISVLSLGDANLTDQGLTLLLRALPRNTILLIEDVDCVSKSRTNDQSPMDQPTVTMATLLNAIDGIGATEGRILFLTTNHPDQLDPALIRPGRIDRKIELSYATADQARRMFLWFFRGSMAPHSLETLAIDFAARLHGGTAPAAIQEHLLRHRDDPTRAAYGPREEVDFYA